MNNIDIEKQFQKYRDSLGNCSRLPTAAPRRSRLPGRASFALGIAVLGASTALFLAWPRSAEAGSLGRFVSALGKVRSIEETFAMQLPSGQWDEFEHNFYQDGKWRCRVFYGKPLAATYIVAGGRALTKFDRLDHATIEPNDPFFFREAPSADDPLNFVRSRIDMGQTDIERRMAVQPHGLVAGQPTYMVTLDRTEDSYHAEILVDKGTDLPIRADVSVTGLQGQGLNHYRMEYKFNQVLAPSLFELNGFQRVVDLVSAGNKLAEAWKRPLAIVDGAEVRDACVTTDGTVWIAVTIDNKIDPLLPSGLREPGGSLYARVATDISPGGVQTKERQLRLDGRPILVVGFVPIDKGLALPSQVSVSFGLRSPNLPGHAPDGSKEPITHGIAVLKPRREPGPMPSYFTALDLDKFSFQVPILVLKARAQGLIGQHRFLDAAHAYEQCAVAYRGFVRYGGYRPLLKAADCYRRAGLTAEADKVTAEAKALEASQVR